jgi:DinB superfamily
VKADLEQLSEYVWGRTRQRVEGLSDDEYFWQPAEGGGGAASPGVEPVSTIAWRLGHLIVCYGENRNRQWLGLDFDPTADRFSVARPAPANAREALLTLDAAYAEWTTVLDLVPESALPDELGPIAGPFARSNKAGFILHMLDEFIHHGAEVALLRDLWRARAGSVGDSSGL